MKRHEQAPAPDIELDKSAEMEMLVELREAAGDDFATAFPDAAKRLEQLTTQGEN